MCHKYVSSLYNHVNPKTSSNTAESSRFSSLSLYREVSRRLAKKLWQCRGFPCSIMELSERSQSKYVKMPVHAYFIFWLSPGSRYQRFSLSQTFSILALADESSHRLIHLHHFSHWNISAVFPFFFII